MFCMNSFDLALFSQGLFSRKMHVYVHVLEARNAFNAAMDLRNTFSTVSVAERLLSLPNTHEDTKCNPGINIL